jgi:hypothetical protein
MCCGESCYNARSAAARALSLQAVHLPPCHHCVYQLPNSVRHLLFESETQALSMLSSRLRMIRASTVFRRIGSYSASSSVEEVEASSWDRSSVGWVS